MDILRQIKKYAEENGQRIAIQTSDSAITYQKLDELSDRMAAWIQAKYPDDKKPIVVYGHKSIFMVLCFLSCVKAGRAYCPVDTSVPISRVESIIDVVNPAIILAAEKLDLPLSNILGISKMKEIIHETAERISDFYAVQEEDIFYIIFTSGSTGVPKGVEITTACLNNFLEWSVNLGTSYEKKLGKRFLNQAPFSFDLSVMDLYTCLACGGTLWTMEKEVQMDYSKMLCFLGNARPNVWISTPSFADMCLSDKQFSDDLIPNLEVFLFCGETLTNHTAKKLQQRFPKAAIMNTYGPTESTVAITEVLISPDLAEKENPLPVGKVKPGSMVQIQREEGEIAEEGERGEIIILGDTVSSGYFHELELTEKAFFQCEINGNSYRGYRTGDIGYIKNDMLYYCGRMDLQIKLHGYRIECEDIEKNLFRLEGVENAVVVPVFEEGKVKSLTAYILTEDEIDSSFEAARRIKARLKEFIPEYMVPKKIIFVDNIPMTNNGKVDRKALGGL